MGDIKFTGNIEKTTGRHQYRVVDSTGEVGKQVVETSLKTQNFVFGFFSFLLGKSVQVRDTHGRIHFIRRELIQATQVERVTNTTSQIISSVIESRAPSAPPTLLGKEELIEQLKGLARFDFRKYRLAEDEKTGFIKAVEKNEPWTEELALSESRELESKIADIFLEKIQENLEMFEDPEVLNAVLVLENYIFNNIPDYMPGLLDSLAEMRGQAINKALELQNIDLPELKNRVRDENAKAAVQWMNRDSYLPEQALAKGRNQTDEYLRLVAIEFKKSDYALLSEAKEEELLKELTAGMNEEDLLKFIFILIQNNSRFQRLLKLPHIENLCDSHAHDLIQAMRWEQISSLMLALIRTDKIDLFIKLVNSHENALEVFVEEIQGRPLRLTEGKLEQIQKGINPPGLIEKILRLKDPSGKPRVLWLYNNTSPFKQDDDIAKLDELFELGYPITTVALKLTFEMSNYRLIEHLLSKVSEGWVMENKDEILALLSRVEDPMIMDLMFKNAPQLASECSLDILQSSINQLHGVFVGKILSSGRKVSPEEMNVLLPNAIMRGNLAVIRKLCEQNESISYPEVLHLETYKTPEARMELLKRYALFSPLEEVQLLVASYPDLAPLFAKVMQTISLMVRFPNPALAADVVRPQNYVSNSWAYAEENREFINNILTDMEKMTRGELLDKIVANRFMRRPNLNPEYNMKQKDLPNILRETPTLKKSMKISDQTIPVKPYQPAINRYSWSIRHLAQFCYNTKNSAWEDLPPSVKIASFINFPNALNYHYTFTDDQNGRHEYPTTVLRDDWGQWIHTSAATINNLEDHAEALHKEILSFNLDLTDPNNKKEFFEKVARGYWLIGTLCERLRGTPHNAMMWLNLVYEHHNLPPPVPKIDHFFLDNTALMLPIEQFIEQWESFFEPPLDATVERKQLEGLLEKDGLLLQFCSEKARSDPDLVRLAIKQNPNAKLYALKGGLEDHPPTIS